MPMAASATSSYLVADSKFGDQKVRELYGYMIEFNLAHNAAVSKLNSHLFVLDREVLLTDWSQIDDLNKVKTIPPAIRQAAEAYSQMLMLKSQFLTKGKARFPDSDTDEVLFNILLFEVGSVDLFLDSMDFSFPLFEIELLSKQTRNILGYQAQMEQGLVKGVMEHKKAIVNLREQSLKAEVDPLAMEKFRQEIQANCEKLIEQNIQFKIRFLKELNPSQLRKLFQVLVLPPAE